MSSKRETAGRGIVLDVSAEIINAAVRRDSSHCVIADALRATVPEARRVSVDLQTIRFTLPDRHRRYVYLTPAPAQEVLVKFDQGHKPAPFLMRLGRPAQIVKTDARKHDRLDDESTADEALGHDEPTTRRRVSDTPHDVQKPPLVLGGKTPPTAALSSTRGRRRTFGLKSLKP